MSDNEEDYTTDDKVVPHPWEHSTCEPCTHEMSTEDYIALQEQCRLHNLLIPFE